MTTKANQNNLIDLVPEIKRRLNIRRAESNGDWQQVKASFALEGIEMDERDAEMVGRILAGEITCEQAIEEANKEFGKIE